MLKDINEKIVFNCDLDSTVIYSSNKLCDKDKVNVEIYQGREISFLTPKTKENLKLINKKILFVPTTTRTEEQFKRVKLDIGNIKYALVSNGGILLEDGKVDEKWYEESLKLVEYSQGELKKAVDILTHDPERCFDVRYPDNLFVFTKSNDCKTLKEKIEKELNLDIVDVYENGIKVYVVPKKLRKSNAVERFAKKIKAEKIIAAGDSDFDAEMASIADIGILHYSQRENIKIYSPNNKILFLGEENIFSEELTDYIIENLI